MGAQNQNGQTGNTKLYGVDVNSSILGQPLNVVLGTRKTNQLILWVDGFQSQSISKKAAGGKGGGKSGQYNYSADVIAALCAGPVSGTGSLWSGQSFLGNINAAEQFAISSTNFTFTPANGASAVNNFGVTPTSNVSGTFNDFGAPSPTEISATTSTPFTQVPVGTTPGQGEYTYNPSTGTYTFSPDDAGTTVTTAYSFLLTTINQQETDIIPSTLMIAVSPEFPFSADLGVVFSSTTAANDGVALQKVNGTPTVSGTYSQTGSGPAVYRFAAADEGAQITITFQISDTGAVSAGESNTLDFQLNLGEAGQEPFPFLTSSFPQAALGYTSIATALFEPMQLGPSAEIQQNNIEVITPDIFGGVYATTNLPILDCNPVQVILRILTDTTWGMGVGPQPFPVSAIDNGPGGTWGEPGTPSVQQSGSTAYNWFAANSFFISALLNSQDSGSSIIGKFLEAGVTAAYVSEGLLKLVPYGDTTVAGNGCTWVAPTQAAASLDDTNFLAKEGTDPVSIDRSSWQDAWSTVQVNFSPRQFQYNQDTLQSSLQDYIDAYGNRVEDAQDWDFICELPAAQFASQMRLQRQTSIRNTYKFSLPFNFSYIEPMDLCLLSTSSIWANDLNNENLGIVDLPVRITKVVDNPGEDGLQFEAEDYPFGAGQLTVFNKGTNTSTPLMNTQANPGTSEVVFFEAAGRLVQFGPNQIWLGCCGTSNNYGGTTIFASQDNEDFVQVAQSNQTSVLGVLAEAFPAGEEQDTVNSLVVTLAENSAGLVSATQQAAENLTTLCFCDGEFIAFSAAAVTGQNTWTMNQFILRGQMGSPITAHAAGSLFLRLDGSITKYTYDPSFNGKQTFFKFAPFNSFGNAQTPLSQLQSVSLTLSATNSGVIDGSSGLIEQGSVDGLTGTLTGINTTIAGLTASTTANLTVLADMSSVSFLTPSEQIAFMQQFTSMLATQTSLDATASSLGVSSSAYDAAVANVSTQLIAAGAPSNFASTWPTMTTFGPATDIQTDLNNLFAEVASQQAALQSAISAQQASTAQAAAVSTAASNALTQINTAVNTLNEQAPVVVSTLPTLPSSSFPPGKYVFDLQDNALFVVDTAGSAFQPLAVPATSITGTLSAAQVASLAASQITGQLTASQIASVAAAQVIGQLTASQIAAVNAASVGDGLVASQIASVEASVVSGALTGATIPTGQLTGQVQAAQIQANSLGAGQIAANSIITSNLTVANFTNLIPNPNSLITNLPSDTFESQGLVNFGQPNTVLTPTGFGRVVTVADTGGSAQFPLNQIPCKPGDVFNFTAQACVAPGEGNATIFLAFADASETGGAGALGTPNGNSATSANFNAPSNLSVTATAPANAAFCQAFILLNGTTVPNLNAIFNNFLMRQCADASVIVDGTITAAQIAASTITGENVAASTITGSNIVAGTITAGNIASETITGTQIAGSTITGANIVGGTITAGLLAANSVTAASIEAGTITSAQIAAGTIQASNIAAATITGGQISANTISGNNIQAGTITGNNIQAGTITAGQIAAGAIGATQIAANSISTTNLTVADLTNNVYNPGFESGLASWSIQDPSATAISTAQAHSGTQSLELLPVSGEFAIINANVVPAVPGQQFISQIFSIATNGTSGSVNLRMYWYTASEAPSPAGSTNAIDAAPFAIGTTWAQATANFTVPSNAVAVQFGIVSGNISGGDIFLDDAYFRRMTDGSLIVDGSISSASIVSGGITADVLTSGSINASVISVTNLNASNISTGTLDAAQVIFSDGSSVNTATKMVTASSTLSAAVETSSTTPLATGLGFTTTINSTSDVINIFASLVITTPGVETFQVCTITLVEDVTVITAVNMSAQGTNSAGAEALFAQPFFFSMSNIGPGAHEFQLFINSATSGQIVTLQPTISGTYAIGQRITTG